MAANNVLNMLVPISRFNKGEANKIFEEVKRDGFKVVIKNNQPIGVIMAPELYESLLENQLKEENSHERGPRP